MFLKIMKDHAFWWVPIVLFVLVAHGIGKIVQKNIVGKVGRTQRLFLQFLFCAIFASGLAVFGGQFAFNGIVVMVGMLNGFACYFHWRAIHSSLSKTSIFTFADDIIAMALSYAILGEGKIINTQSGVGIIFCLLAAILLGIRALRHDESLQLFIYIGIYSVIWGFAIFCQKYFAFKEMPVLQFLANWYVASAVSASILLLFYKDQTVSNKMSAFRVRDYAEILFLSAVIFLSLGMAFWAYSLSPQTIVQPIFLVSEAVVPTLIGLFFFRESSKLDRAEWLYASIGILGVILIAVGYSRIASN